MDTPGIGFYVERMLHGLLQTMWMGAVGTGLALLGGMLLALVRMRGPLPLRALVLVFLEVVRGTPPLIQLFIVYFGLTQYGIFLTSTVAGVLWLSIYGTAYATEVFRAGFTGVPHGQTEAAQALGLGPVRTFSRIMLPQAVVNMLPPLTNFIVLQVKTTTLLYIIGVHELISQARLGAINTREPLIMYGIAGLIFVVLNIAISRGLSFAGSRMAWSK